MNAGRYAELQTTSSLRSLPPCFKGFLRASVPGPQQARGWLGGVGASVVKIGFTMSAMSRDHGDHPKGLG